MKSYYGKLFTWIGAGIILWSCAGQPGAGGDLSPQAIDKLNKAQARDDKFQKVAFKKINELDAAMKQLRKSQIDLNNAVKALRHEIKSSPGGAGSAGQLDSLAQVITRINQQLQQLQAGGRANGSAGSLPWTGNQLQMLSRSDQQAILQRFGEPIERHKTDDNTVVWLYRNGVVSFDMNGHLTSIKFD